MRSDQYTERLRGLARRSREVLLLAAIVGATTGLGIAGFDACVERLLDETMRAPLWLVACLPAVGLAVGGLALRYLGPCASPATADEYIRTYHDGTEVLDARPFPAKLIAAIATLGSGGALGLEGPSIYLGATVGSVATRRLRRFLTGSNAKVLMVAGAAAGVAAIFKAPATGAIFALEVPYRDDLGRKLLLPALVGAATGYLTFVAIDGTTRLFPITGHPAFNLTDLGGAIALGVAAGLLARGFAGLLVRAKRVATTLALWQRVVLGGITLAICALLGDAVTSRPLTLGPGYEAIAWARDPRHGVIAVMCLLALRCTATTATLGGGGAGGLFIPLVVAGALLGRIAGGMVSALDTDLFTVIGIASVLGAGYRVPLAAVMFVAEATGRPGFIVPGLLAAVAAELVMGRVSVTPYQQASGIPTGTTP